VADKAHAAGVQNQIQADEGGQNAREAGGRKGHFSGVVGSEPTVRLLVQFENALPVPSPCLFR
jgi:hypothetical protein